LDASRKNGLASTVSARALNVAARNSLSGLLHHGTSPQRIRTELRFLSRSVATSIGCGADVVTRLEIVGWSVERELVQRDDLAQSLPSRTTSQH
jgi:hypothetical protein